MAWHVLVVVCSALSPARAEPAAGFSRHEFVMPTGHDMGSFGALPVAFSSDGRYLLTGGSKGKAILWEAATGRQLRTFRAIEETVYSVQFSGDGQRVLTGDTNFVVRNMRGLQGTEVKDEDIGAAVLWDAATGERLRTFRGHTDGVLCATFSPDERSVLTGSFDGTAIVWDAATGQKLHTLVGHGDPVQAVNYSPDGRHVVTGSTDETAIVWDAATGERLRTFVTHQWADSVAFSPDGRHLVAGVGDEWGDHSDVVFWDVATGEKVRAFRGHTGPIVSVSFSRDGRRLLSASDDGSAILWDVLTGKQIQTFPAFDDPDRQAYKCDVVSAALRPDGQQVAMVIVEREEHNKRAALPLGITLWDVEPRRQVQRFDPHSATCPEVVFSGDGKQLAAVYGDIGDCQPGGPFGTVLWELSTGRIVQSFTGYKTPVWGMDFSRDGRLIVSGTYDHQVVLWDAATGRKLRTFEERGGALVGGGLVFHPDGTQLLSISQARAPDLFDLKPVPWDAEAILWDTAPGKRLRTFEEPSRNVWWGGFTPDGSRVVALLFDGTVIMWEAASGRKLRTFKVEDPFSPVVFRSDGQRMFIASRTYEVDKLDGHTRVHVLDPATGDELRRFQLPHPGTYVHDFSPDRRLMLTTNLDQGVKLWDVATNKEVHSLGPREYWAFAGAFSPDGRYVATTARDEPIRLWDVGSGRERVRLVALNSGRDWLVYTPEGYFDASPGVRKLAVWRADGKLVPTDSYEKQFHRPDLVARALQGLPIDEPKPDPSVH